MSARWSRRPYGRRSSFRQPRLAHAFDDSFALFQKDRAVALGARAEPANAEIGVHGQRNLGLRSGFLEPAEQCKSGSEIEMRRWVAPVEFNRPAVPSDGFVV